VGLPLCDTGDDFTCSQLIINQLDKSVGRNHLQTITQFDRDSLKEATYVKDVLIDFWYYPGTPASTPALERSCRQRGSSEAT